MGDQSRTLCCRRFFFLNFPPPEGQIGYFETIELFSVPLRTSTSFWDAGEQIQDREVNGQHSGVVPLIATLALQSRPHPPGHAPIHTVPHDCPKNEVKRGVCRTVQLFLRIPKSNWPRISLPAQVDNLGILDSVLVQVHYYVLHYAPAGRTEPKENLLGPFNCFLRPL